MVIKLIFIISIGLKIYFDAKYYRLLNKKINKEANTFNNTKIGISIIICCKNEVDNLKNNLKFITNQQYENFEIIIVDDGSIDHTEEYVKTNFPTINFIKTNDFNNLYPGKKHALEIGVKAAKNEIVLLTDADCKPASKKWAERMINPFQNEKTEIVLGISHYKTYKHSFLNKIIQYDSFITAINYCSFALANQTYMGIGRNLAYRKKTFLKANSLIQTMEIASGDDDLLINEISNKQNTTVCLEKDSITLSEPKRSWKSYFTQKKRHYTTPKLYKLKDQILLSLNYISYLVIPIAIIYSISNQQYLYIVITVIFKIISTKILLTKFSKIIRYHHLLWYSPLIEIFLIGLQPIIYLSNSLMPAKKWK